MNVNYFYLSAVLAIHGVHGDIKFSHIFITSQVFLMAPRKDMHRSYVTSTSIPMPILLKNGKEFASIRVWTEHISDPQT